MQIDVFLWLLYKYSLIWILIELLWPATTNDLYPKLSEIMLKVLYRCCVSTIITKLMNAYRSIIFIKYYNETFGISQQFNEEVWFETVVWCVAISLMQWTLYIHFIYSILYIQCFKECIQQVIYFTSLYNSIPEIQIDKYFSQILKSICGFWNCSSLETSILFLPLSSYLQYFLFLC